MEKIPNTFLARLYMLLCGSAIRPACSEKMAASAIVHVCPLWREDEATLSLSNEEQSSTKNALYTATREGFCKKQTLAKISGA